MAKKLPLITDFDSIPEEALVPVVEQPYEIPSHWKWVRFEYIVDVLPSPQVKVKKSDYLTEGKYPIIDQGIDFIAGYCNSAAGLIDHHKELIVFGDHTREVKLIDFPFIQGADGIKILRSVNTLLPRFLFYWLSTEPIQSRGYRRHFPLLKKCSFPLPPLKDQQRIVDHLENTYSKIDDVIQRLEQFMVKAPERRSELIQAAMSGFITKSWRDAQELSAKSNPTTVEDSDTVETGSTLSSKNPNDDGASIPTIRSTDLDHSSNAQPVNSRRGKTPKKRLPLITDFDSIPEDALIPEDEQPYEIPAQWKWVRLGALITLLSGRDAPLSRCNDIGVGIPYVMGASNFVETTLNIERWIETPEVVSPPGSLLLTVKGTIGKLHVQKEEKLNLSRQVMALIPGPCLTIDYLRIFVSAQVARLEAAAVGLIPGISRTDVLGTPIPLSPLDEQHQIVDYLEKTSVKTDTVMRIVQEVHGKLTMTRSQIATAAFAGILGS